MLLAGLSVLLLLVITGLSIFYIINVQRAEHRLQTEAELAYTSGQYAESAKKYKQLSEEYPDSERKPRYDFSPSSQKSKAMCNGPALR